MGQLYRPQQARHDRGPAQAVGTGGFAATGRISDAVVENNTPGSLDRMGITYEWLREIKSEIVFVRLSSFGQNGPYRSFRALGLQSDAFCGHDILRRYRDRDPSYNTWAVPSDYSGGVAAAIGCMLALIHRKRTGQGQLVDISMVENFLNLIGHIVMDYTMNGRVQESHGNRDPDMLQGVYRCQGDDRWVAITISTMHSGRALSSPRAIPNGSATPGLTLSPIASAIRTTSIR